MSSSIRPSRVAVSTVDASKQGKPLTTLPDVFIIESLDRASNGGIQGKALMMALSAFGRYPRYLDVASKMEFLDALMAFKKSTYRYLHISCHGNIYENGLQLRNGEQLTFADVAECIGKLHLPLTRMFLSACGMGQKDCLANNLFSDMKTRAVHSILAPSEDIDLTESLVFWTAFYGEMYMRSEDTMKDSDIVVVAQRASNCCRRKFAYFSYVPTKNQIKRLLICPQTDKIDSPTEYPLS